ncbi:hypothetical protein [Streptomyces sp. NPDC049887]
MARTHEVAAGAGKFCADTLAKKLPKRAWQLSAPTSTASAQVPRI